MSAYIQNRKAYADFEFLDTFEAGLELFGHEVKSLKKGQGSLRGAYIIVRGREAYLVGATIPPYQVSNMPHGYDEARPRRLLLSQKELIRLAQVGNLRGLTIVPVSVYNRRKKLKLEIAIVRRRKKYDKREVLKKRAAVRDISRTIKRVSE
ncbi:MAG: SsrA-binding protein SmpB [Candidatus Vogelbacteria bacterium]|nr:SsrA-binding protein SmpB [Candidatus Vogelbacteria bacterium]